jgi:beta-glucosidase
MKTSRRLFPKNFTWGVATAAPQIEGAAFEDGKGSSIWDGFSRIPGEVRNGDTLDAACDHYHRYRDDVALMAGLGVKHYRMSIAWPRILPEGKGGVNQKGVDFYHRLFDELARYNITPWVTMFHWDLPQALENEGGWRSRATVDAFARYADIIVKAFRDRVKSWFTVNEIRCFTTYAYGAGSMMAPGASEPAGVVNQTFHHAIMCHGHGVRAVREHGGRGARVGIADNPDIPVPVTETEPDIKAASDWFRERNAHILEPIYTGRYSPAYLRRCGKDRPKVARGDMALISAPADFLGLNIYTARFVRADGNRRRRFEELELPDDFPRTCDFLKIIPQAIYWGPLLAARVYGAKAIYITENGCGYDAEAAPAAGTGDLHRREFLRAYLGELNRAIHAGAPVRGYFLWSLMDNFEWAAGGYTRRFGIVHVDYKTQRRTPKLSASWYRDVMRENRVL